MGVRKLHDYWKCFAFFFRSACVPIGIYYVSMDNGIFRLDKGGNIGRIFQGPSQVFVQPYLQNEPNKT